MTDLPTVELAPDLAVTRIVTGLWQMADQERDGRSLDLDRAAEALAGYGRDGFLAFDMADHYGSAEIVAGRAARLLAAEGLRPAILTKWCPAPGDMTPEVVRRGVETALERIGTDRIDLMQFHWWRYEDPRYLDALEHLMRLREEGMIRHLGLTNVDAAHLRLVVKNGIEIASNQICFSLLDRRAAGRLSEVAGELGVKLLAFGTLCGGFLSERWLGQPEPAAVGDWSKMKYRRFIAAAGGWDAFQGVLRAAADIAERHGASIANVATAWVLDHPAVAAVIVGARLGEAEHRADNRALFDLALDGDDHACLDAALARTRPIPGDCGDEYRRPPFLTASGDLSHHLAALPPLHAPRPVPGRPARERVDTGTEWEAKAGFSRAVRVGDRILVSGTTATDAAGRPVGGGDVEAETTFILDRIAGVLEAFGASLADVVRTRVYLADETRWEEAARAHGRAFAGVLPANTLIGGVRLVGPYAVEIEAEAVLDAPRSTSGA